MRFLAAALVTLAILAAPAAEAAPFKRTTIIATASAFAAHATGLASRGQSVALGLGVGAGIYVTKKLHASTGFWARRIPGTRYRMADLPVGGTLAFGAAFLARSHPELSHMLIAAGTGMTLGAVGTGLSDPLPKK